METDDLIRNLAQDLRPVAARALERRLAAGVAAGVIGALLALFLWLGLGPDMAAAVTSFPFWMKLGYTTSLAAISIGIAWRLAHPESRPDRWYLLLLLPLAVMAGLAAYEIAASEASKWRSLLMGMSAAKCSPRILLISAPVFAGMIWSYRRFAPTRLRLAGAAAGLAAGAIGAAAYALYCREVAASFVLVWYTLGIALTSLAGAILGPRLLRW